METETDKVLVVDTIYREYELEAQRPIYKDETQQNASDKEIIDALCCPGDRSNDRCFVV